MKKTGRALAFVILVAMVGSLMACRTTESQEKNRKPFAKTLSHHPYGFNCEVPKADCEIEFLPEEERFQYDMTLELDPENLTIGGHVVVSFYNTSEVEWDTLCLRDYSSLFVDWKTAKYAEYLPTNGAQTILENIRNEDTNQTLSYERDEDVSVVWIPLDEKLPAGEAMTMSYDFVAKIPTVADRYGADAGVFNVTNFYPILAVYEDDGFSHEGFYSMGECFYSEISDYHVTLTMPQDMKVLSTGVEKDSNVSNGKITYTIDAPCVRDFDFSASADFRFFESDYEGIHLRVVYSTKTMPVAEMDDVAQACLKASEDAFAALNSAFGKYPYPEFDCVLAPIAAGGMEYPNLIICTINEHYCSKSEESFPYYILSKTVAHEIGHQWFMGIVGSNSGMEPWLDESITSYTEFVYLAYLGENSRYERYGREKLDITSAEAKQVFIEDGMYPLNRSYYEFLDDSTYVGAVYSFGQIALYQMEEILGQKAFYAILREYVHRNAFTNSTEDRFFEVLYDCAGDDNEALNELIESVFDR